VAVTRCAVLGKPIAHSLSPVLHRAAYAEAGLDWTYDAIEVDEAGLPGFLDSLDDSWRGLSLTMPLKRTVVPMLDAMSPRARLAGAANTVVLSEGRRTGHNTDIGGAAAALRERWDGPVDRAVVVGGGATAASVLLALADLGCAEATLLVREPARAEETFAAVRRHPTPPAVEVLRAGEVAPRPVDVLVSTVPDEAEEPLLGWVGSAGVVFEVRYDPWPTPLARAALEAGRPLVGGLDMLLHQAAEQVVLMTGLPQAPLEAMRTALESRP
jgi:shikimate dehydrogenase